MLIGEIPSFVDVAVNLIVMTPWFCRILLSDSAGTESNVSSVIFVLLLVRGVKRLLLESSGLHPSCSPASAR